MKIFGYSIKGLTVLNPLNNYIDLCCERQMSPSTINGHKKCVNELSYLLDIFVTELTAGIIKNWVQEQTSSLQTMCNILSFFKSSLDDVVIDGLIPVNPVSSLSVSRYYNAENDKNKDDYVVAPFSPSEIDLILNYCNDELHYNLFKFAFATGLRSSELCGVKWKDVDLTNKTININSARVVGVEKTKNKAGTRTIELNAPTMSALYNQKQYRLLGNEYIFLDPKTKSAWTSADAIRKKHRYQH